MNNANNEIGFDTSPSSSAVEAVVFIVDDSSGCNAHVLQWHRKFDFNT